METEMNPAILRGIVYVATMLLGLLAAAAAAAGLGTYNADTGVYVVEVNIPTLVGYLAAMVGSGGLSLTALIKGWGNKPASPSPVP
jgi:hypothetical protein